MDQSDPYIFLLIFIDLLLISIYPYWLVLIGHLIFIDQLIPVTIVIIPDVLVINLITKLYQSCLVVMASQTMLAGMKFSITGTPNSHVDPIGAIDPIDLPSPELIDFSGP